MEKPNGLSTTAKYHYADESRNRSSSPSIAVTAHGSAGFASERENGSDENCAEHMHVLVYRRGP